MLKQRVRRAFNRAAGTYDAAADVQRRVVQELLRQLVPTADPALIVDIGCGTGYALDPLRERHPGAQLLAVDLAERMLDALPEHPLRLCADAEHLPLASASADLYWSSLAVQWCHLPAVLAETRRILRPRGTLALATLASRTFHELRTAFEGLDAYAHTHRFLTRAEIERHARDAGFQDIEIHQTEIRALYPDLSSLLRAVKAVGANEVSGERRRGMLGRSAWTTARNRYEAFRTDGLISATYDVVYLTARSPD